MMKTEEILEQIFKELKTEYNSLELSDSLLNGSNRALIRVLNRKAKLANLMLTCISLLQKAKYGSLSSAERKGLSTISETMKRTGKSEQKVFKKRVENRKPRTRKHHQS